MSNAVTAAAEQAAGPTVADLVATPTLGLTLVAGSAGADRQVGWAHVSELEDPTPWLQGSELVMTTGIAVPERPAKQRAYVALLDEHGVSALAVSEELLAPPLSKAMLAEADRRAFPILTVSLQVPFIAISQEVAAHNHVTAQRRLAAVLRLFGTLRGVASENLGNRELFARLEELSGYELAVCSRAGRPLLEGVPVPPPDVVERLPAIDEAPPRIEGGYAVTLPVAGEVQGYLVALPRAAEPMGLAAVQHIATIAALQIATRLHDYELRRREGAETLAELLAGTLGPGPAANRLELAGFSPEAELQLFAVAGQTGPPDDAAVARALYGSGSPHLLLSLGELFVLGLAQAETEQALLDVGSISVGVSRPFAASAGFAQPRREALWALFRAIDMGAAVARFDDDRDVGWLPSDAASQREVVDRILGPAIAYDRAHRSELVRSLEVWLEHDRSAQRTAGALHVHPHTLAYRLRRIEQLTGRDLTRTQDTVDVWLALRARRLLEREAVSPAPTRARGGR